MTQSVDETVSMEEEHGESLRVRPLPWYRRWHANQWAIAGGTLLAVVVGTAGVAFALTGQANPPDAMLKDIDMSSISRVVQPPAPAVAEEAPTPPKAELLVVAPVPVEERVAKVEEPPVKVVEKPLPPPPVAVVEEKPKAGCYGTAVNFVDNVEKATKQAEAADQLMFVITISGNFEDAKFT